MTDIKKTGPKDVFIHLLAIIFLYVSVVSFGALVFGFINIYFPDALQGDFGRYARSSLRFPLATLVVVFPLFIWFNTFTGRDLLKHPEKRDLKTRKWLLYFTIFATVLVIVGDLVTLIWRFLGGEITPRFILKVITVLIIAGAVFLYYGWNLRKDTPASKNPKMRLFIQGIVGVGALAIILGFFVAGSPQAERLRQFDDQRLGHLQQLQSEIVFYWQTKQKLPTALDELRDEIRGFIPPNDPETGTPYEYRPTGETSFELCATFKTSSSEQDRIAPGKAFPAFPEGVIEGTWGHGAERTCFSRTIDPDRFPPFEKPLR